MQRITVEPKAVVYEIVCDRCGKEVQRDGGDFELTTSIGFQAGYASIFGDGNQVDIDLCEPCLRDTLGTWLRVTTPDTSLAHMLEKFKLEVHGGEFPSGQLPRRADVADPPRAVAHQAMNETSGYPDFSSPTGLMALVEQIVRESGNPVDFDAMKWTAKWLGETNRALSGRKSSE